MEQGSGRYPKGEKNFGIGRDMQACVKNRLLGKNLDEKLSLVRNLDLFLSFIIICNFLSLGSKENGLV